MGQQLCPYLGSLEDGFGSFLCCHIEAGDAVRLKLLNSLKEGYGNSQAPAQSPGQQPISPSPAQNPEGARVELLVPSAPAALTPSLVTAELTPGSFAAYLRNKGENFFH